MKIAWNAVFGRLGSLNGPETPETPEVVDLSGEEDWEDVDPDAGRAAEIERRKRILKGRIARATLRETEIAAPGESCMPPKRDSIGESSGNRMPPKVPPGTDARRSSICLLYTSPSPRD